MKVNESQVMKQIVLNKAASGRFLNVRRCIMDLNAINDYDADSNCKESTTDMLKQLLTSKPLKESDDSKWNKVFDRLDAMDDKIAQISK